MRDNALMTIPITVFEVSDAERNEQLIVGIDALGALIKAEREKFERLETLLNVVRAARSTSHRILIHEEIAAVFEASYSVLDECYCDGGTIEYTERLAKLASAARLAIGVASGDYVPIVGGDFSNEDEKPYPIERKRVEALIREFGLKETRA